MDLVVASSSDITLDAKALTDIVMPQFETAARVKIATGYITGDAIAYLENFVAQNNRPYIDLLIGMHYKEGSFSESQYHAIKRLSRILKAKKLGSVYISTEICYHGKMYAFLDKSGKCIGASVGSSNLGNTFLGSENTVEADCVFDDREKCNLIRKRIDDVIEQLGTDFDSVVVPKFRKVGHPLDHVIGVEKIPPKAVDEAFSKKTRLSFDLKLKTEEKSNLNAFFATGRYSSSTNTYRPRPWYEVEIIVSKAVTSKRGYPQPKTPFCVITSDGWCFKCETQGDYSKNFRSHKDLRILGRWIKGSMEDSGALKTGEKITADVLKSFGHQYIRLTKTTENGLWTLEFA